MYGPIFDLLIAAQNKKILVEVENRYAQERNEQSNSGGKTHSNNFKFVEDSEIQTGETRRSTTATSLVRKLRWSTLGLQFDWSKVCTLFAYIVVLTISIILYFISLIALNSFSL